MVRFKQLSTRELAILEKEFVRFLAAQSILADDWIRIKDLEPEQANNLIADFSDLVYGTVMRDALFLELKTSHTLYCYQCLNDRFVLIGLELNHNSEVDLRRLDTIDIKTVAAKTEMRVYTTEKPYMKEKEDEVFGMMELGCEITGGEMFKFLGLLL